MTEQTVSSQASVLKRFGPIVILLAGLGAFFAFGLQDYLSFDSLKDNRAWLENWQNENPILSVMTFGLIYIVVVAFSLPGGAVMTIAGGFLFGLFVGTTVTVFAATIGATAVFLAARTALGDALKARAGSAIGRMEDGFRDNALSYMLVLRLVPLFPFFLVNLAPAFLNVPLRTYTTATLIGIIPGTFVYTSVGNGLGAIFDKGETPDLGIIFDPAILTPLIGLSVLALVPVIYRRFKKAPKGE